MNPQHPDLESGALSIRATGLFILLYITKDKGNLLSFPVKLMRSTKFTIFHQLKAILHGSLILRGRIISLLTICTG